MVPDATFDILGHPMGGVLRNSLRVFIAGRGRNLGCISYRTLMLHLPATPDITRTPSIDVTHDSDLQLESSASTPGLCTHQSRGTSPRTPQWMSPTTWTHTWNLLPRPLDSAFIGDTGHHLDPSTNISHDADPHSESSASISGWLGTLAVLPFSSWWQSPLTCCYANFAIQLRNFEVLQEFQTVDGGRLAMDGLLQGPRIPDIT